MVAHGARAAGWDAPFQLVLAKLVQDSTAQGGERQFRLAFLEHKLPNVGMAVAELVAIGCTHITLVPMLLGVGMHAREDLPRLMAEAQTAHPTTAFRITETLGENAVMLEALASFVQAKAP